jgi:hypothetical protein
MNFNHLNRGGFFVFCKPLNWFWVMALWEFHNRFNDLLIIQIHIMKPMQFHEFDVFVFECSFFVLLSRSFRLRRSFSEGTQRSKGMLFLVTDIIINIINRAMRNTNTPKPRCQMNFSEIKLLLLTK